MDKSQIWTKKDDDAKYAKVWALHKDAIKLLTWEPLLIVRRLSYNPVSKLTDRKSVV